MCRHWYGKHCVLKAFNVLYADDGTVWVYIYFNLNLNFLYFFLCVFQVLGTW